MKWKSVNKQQQWIFTSKASGREKIDNMENFLAFPLDTIESGFSLYFRTKHERKPQLNKKLRDDCFIKIQNRKIWRAIKIFFWWIFYVATWKLFKHHKLWDFVVRQINRVNHRLLLVRTRFSSRPSLSKLSPD